MNAPPIRYIARFLTREVADQLEAELLALTWERRDDAPRFELFMSDVPEPYTYGRGRGRRTYAPHPLLPIVARVRDVIAARVGEPAPGTRAAVGAAPVWHEAVFLNRYDGARDHLGWHSDDSPEMDHGRPICVLSLGAARELQFRKQLGTLDRGERPVFGEVSGVVLEHGSLLVMDAGMQLDWQHRVPKVDRVVDRRISLTFRGHLPGVAP